jgi:hypothetical protein
MNAARRADTCRALIRERALVGAALGDRLCAAPAWDMLLDLYLARAETRTTYAWAVCLAAHAPMSTAHRHLAAMSARGHVVRSDDPADHRRVAVALSPGTAQTLDALMDALAALRTPAA